MASIADLYVDAGTSYTTDITVSGDDGFPLDLSSFQIIAQLRRHNYSATAIDFDVEVVDAGIIRLSLTRQKTAQLKNSRYLYDVFLIDPLNSDTNANRVVEGIVYVNPAVTRIIS